MIVSPHKNPDELQKMSHDGSNGMPYVAHLPGRTDLYLVMLIREWDEKWTISMTNQKGKIHVTDRLGLRVHTYTAPDDGWMVNTHFVELPTQLIAIDAQYTIPYAKEALAYAATLG